MSLNLTAIRARFPGLNRSAVFFDNPGGTQISQPAIDRMNNYLVNHNANHEGAFATSQESDAILEEAHTAMADFYNASSAQEIIFGNNMTTLTLHISRSIARTWNQGDTIVVTKLDHDANISPWVLAARDRGVNVKHVPFHLEDGSINMEEMNKSMESKPRLVAIGYASNSLGTINPLRKIIAMAHTAGALVYVDAVQYAPHGPIDVQRLGCDFLVSSAYKFFGPHAGILYGRQDLLEELFAYKVRPATDRIPGKFETGTQNHEGIAGVLGTIEYLDWIGREFGQDYLGKYQQEGFSGRRLYLKMALEAIRSYEFELSRSVLDILEEIPGVTIYGNKDGHRLEERVPTFSFNLKNWRPRALAQKLAEHGIFVWDGNYYALAVTESLGLEGSGGMVRVGPVHYNTVEEVRHFGEALGKITAS